MKSVIVLVFAASLCRTLALPDGAPLQACENLTPSGHSGTPRPGRSSNTVNIDDFVAVNDSTIDYVYVPGATYFLSLTSTGTFRGFLIQARTLSGDPVGQFVIGGDATNIQLSNCQPSNIAVTHTNREDKTYVEFYWIAPDMDVGGIQFHYTTVRVFEIYWVDETTETIFGPGGPEVGSASITAVSLWSTLTVALTVAVKHMI